MGNTDMENTNIENTKKNVHIAEDLYGDLKLSPWEMIVANAIVLYLYRSGGDEARKAMLPVVKETAVDVATAEADDILPEPVIDGSKLAELVDLATEGTVDLFDTGWHPEEGDETLIKQDVLNALSSLHGEAIVRNMDTEFAEFVVRCGRWVQTL
ncbi:MAG: hypothetical protein LIP11_05995 [Clostridiales bacterium]|nr:hypothetical protein [Clostridiales bacterium]